MKGKLNRKKKESAGEENPIIPLEDKKDSGKITGENSKDTLVFLVDRRKKKIDHTITTPDKYISRYHYDSKNLDRYIELCPHCRKPTLDAYRRTVADSALNYLEAREEKRGRRSNRKLFAGLAAGGLVFSTALYYLLIHVLSGARF
ncbi:MAG: hypothetical protein WBM69_07565 [Desulfobacterales bacterium]